ncbi:unnamed protein product [Paramecium primaurelia]|uniref:Uncharacterized protein n=2 Tax=Paramecium TaxID=5884 RepID=A0A8S1YAL9_9CILI|nr:unnamed protein product [Paramecium primaurelia]CAD8210829.1 unnamed protein product [Paramecium pentaurelia]
MQQRFQKLEQIIIKFSDKHQLLRRGIYVGFIINAGLFYSQMTKFAALKRMQEYMVEKTQQFENRLISEQEQIIKSLKE